ncbi:MAG TPA: BrnT family toxin [Ignavibacteriaceae bacterium]|nr:BrnT family toxin [Ignavibacteriaceae bacterium]
MLLFEWDREKAKKNFIKHNVSFEEAITVFYDPLSATFNDPDHSFGEQRFITIGYSSLNHLLVVSHTDRRETVRIISARYATKKERKKHEN